MIGRSLVGGKQFGNHLITSNVLVTFYFFILLLFLWILKRQKGDKVENKEIDYLYEIG